MGEFHSECDGKPLKGLKKQCDIRDIVVKGAVLRICNGAKATERKSIILLTIPLRSCGSACHHQPHHSFADLLLSAYNSFIRKYYGAPSCSSTLCDS